MIGIYKITNLLNHKVYIGQSNDIERRWDEHKGALERGKHTNKLLQYEYNKYKQFFRFDIIELCSIEDLNDREEYWVKYFNANCEAFGYNATKGGGAARKNKWGYVIKKYKPTKYHKTTHY